MHNIVPLCPLQQIMKKSMTDRGGKSLFIILLGLFYISFTNVQSQLSPLITVNDLGSTNEFSTDGLVAWGIIPRDISQSIFVKIVDFNMVCNASGDRIDTSYVSVIVHRRRVTSWCWTLTLAWLEIHYIGGDFDFIFSAACSVASSSSPKYLTPPLVPLLVVGWVASH